MFKGITMSTSTPTSFKISHINTDNEIIFCYFCYTYEYYHIYNEEFKGNTKCSRGKNK